MLKYVHIIDITCLWADINFNGTQGDAGGVKAGEEGC